MKIEFVTKEDLRQFKEELLNQIKLIVSNSLNAKRNPEFLRGREVKELMKISTGTLQNIRTKQLLNPAKIGGILYYRFAEIDALLRSQNA